MQTVTKGPTRARKQPAPFSTAAHRLIEQIQADARAALMAELSAKDANGAEWHRGLPTMVCNDFGNLVEVPA